MKHPEYSELTGEEVVINLNDYEAKMKDITLTDIELIQNPEDNLWYWVIECPLCENGKIFYTDGYQGGHPCDGFEECSICDDDLLVDLMIQPCEKYPEDLKLMGIDFLWSIMHVNSVTKSVQEDIKQYA